MIQDLFIQGKNDGIKKMAVLIDPDHASVQHLSKLLSVCDQTKIDFILQKHCVKNDFIFQKKTARKLT